MDFNFGEVLSRAWQITWRHKTLWGFSLLPMIPVIIYIPLLLYFLVSTDFTKGLPDFLKNPGLIFLFFAVMMIMIGISLVLRVFSKSATTSGILQVEEGKDRLTSAEILQGGQRHFWRILGVTILIAIGMLMFFAAFSACLSVVGFVTFGIGSLIGQILFLPATLFFYAVTEQSQAAVVADGMSPADAILYAWKLVNENLATFAVLALVLYVGLTLIGSIAMLPVLLPIFLIVLNKFTTEFSNPALPWIAMSCFVVFMPVYLLLQAGTMLYTKSAFMITYLRLTRNLKLQPLPRTVEATS